MLNSGQNLQLFAPCDLEIWQMTLKNNRVPLLCYSSCVHDFIAICEFKLELQSRNGYVEFWPLWHWPLTLTFCINITSVQGNNSWKFHDDMMMGRRSENNNTPQPLDQRTNSPFIGQQVGNCKSFTLTHYLADLFAMYHGPRSIPLCIQHHIQLISLSFQVSRPSHS